MKIKLTEEKVILDHVKRHTFSNWALDLIDENEDFHHKIIFADEAHFFLSGFVNKQNMHYWTSADPLSGYIMPVALLVCFFINKNYNHLTVNGVRYRDMMDCISWTTVICGFNKTVQFGCRNRITEVSVNRVCNLGKWTR